jgi:SHS2 domain-containing protein
MQSTLLTVLERHCPLGFEYLFFYYLMPYEILKHTADLRMRVCADTLESLFLDAVKGMMSIMKKDLESEARNPKRNLSISAGDKTALLVDFLNEILALAQTNKEVYPTVILKKLSETEIEAELTSVPVDGFDEDIKAVTYHEAEIRKNSAGNWETILVFDI